MPPETVRATPELAGLIENPQNTPEYLDTLANYVVKTYGYKPLVNYYIRTGLRASQLICRNYLLRLEENNRYLEFLRSELGVGYSLATSVLLATHANNTLTNAFAISHSFADNALTAYEEYRFLTVDREAARALVETVQAKYAEYFMKHVNLASIDSTDTAGGFTFSDAIHAVSVIEYQCTREGIAALLTRSVNNSPTNVNIDMDTGSIIFDSAQNVTSAKDKKVKETNPTATPPTSEKLSNKGANAGNNQGAGNQGGGRTLNNDVVQACLTVQSGTSSTADQKALCKFIGNDAIKAGKANAALQGALRANPAALPSTTSLADVLSKNDQPPFETIRDAMIQTLGVKK